jgi:hypothetical protein
MIHEQRQADYVRNHAMYPAKVAKSMHRNAVAKALGENLHVPAEVLADYRGTDWSNHPLSRNRLDLKPPKPEPKRSSGDGSGFYGYALAMLAAHITGFERRDAELRLPPEIEK